jgi:hypothetical protein
MKIDEFLLTATIFTVLGGALYHLVAVFYEDFQNRKSWNRIKKGVGYNEIKALKKSQKEFEDAIEDHLKTGNKIVIMGYNWQHVRKTTPEQREQIKNAYGTHQSIADQFFRDTGIKISRSRVGAIKQGSKYE